MEYIIGQRWVSHADTQLGLGIISDLDGRLVTVSFPAVAEERTYAMDNAPLSRLRYKEGDQITTLDDDELVVTSVEEVRGLLFYTGVDHHDVEQTIPELELDCFIQLTTPQQRLLNGQFDKLAAYQLRTQTLEHTNRLQQSPARGLMGSRTSLLKHQVYIASEVGQRYAPRVLLADEVGLGKTIEAGMIIHQQLITGRASRILIIVPSTLIHQWLVEMLRRFNLHFSIFDQDRIDSTDSDQNPFESEQLILCSLEFLVNRTELHQELLSSKWDLTIVDEAHHLQWSPDSVSEEYELIEQLAAVSAGILLLTATPEQVGISSHFARLRLLDPTRFFDLDTFIEEEKTYVELNGLVSAVKDGSVWQDPQRLDKLKDYLMGELPENGDTDEAGKLIISKLLDRHGTGRVLFRNTRAAIKGFPERILCSHPLVCPEVYLQAKTNDLREMLFPELQLTDSNWLDCDPRVSWLKDLLKNIRPEKVLVICANAQTALSLEHHLHMHAGIRSAAFYEGLSILERDRAAAYFAESEGGAQVLICSEIGSEGRNFQFAHHLVLFDLPLNPDLLEQRIGRLDRIGQSEDIKIHVPWLQGTAQQTLFQWFDQGLAVFDKSCAAGQAIYEKFADRLALQLNKADDDLPALITDTANFTEQTHKALRDGRDQLLELNSCNPEQAAAIIDTIDESEQSEVLADYMERLCDQFGVDYDYHSEHSLILRPGEHMLTGYFPGLNEDGTSVTFNREKALSREDLQFLSWEHPMVSEAMEMVLTTELGNSAIATINLKGLQPGTLLVETFFSAHCVAPKDLQVNRFLPLNPMRLLVDVNGKDLSAILDTDRLNRLCEKLKRTTGQAIIKQVSSEIEIMLDRASALAQLQLDAILDTSIDRLHTELNGEIQRLSALRRVNPSIRQAEIDHIQYQMEETELHIRHASLQAEAIRLVISK